MAEKDGKNDIDLVIQQDDIDALLRGLDDGSGDESAAALPSDHGLPDPAGGEKIPEGDLSDLDNLMRGNDRGLEPKENDFDTVSQEEIDAFLRGDFDMPLPEKNEVPKPVQSVPSQGEPDLFTSGLVGQADIDALFSEDLAGTAREESRTTDVAEDEDFGRNTLSQNDIEALFSGGGGKPSV
ncbi:hypothetical protein OOT00_07350, partial [Desulfobotulus sp. H1]